MENGDINVTIDEKYPQALGINGIMERVNIWGNSAWDIIVNEHDKGSSFFTSDFANGIELSDDPRIINRLMPLAPDLAVRISPGSCCPGFEHGLRLFAVACLRLPEELVFFRDNHEWVERFLNKNRSYRVEPITTEIKTPTGYALVSTIRVKSTKSND